MLTCYVGANLAFNMLAQVGTEIFYSINNDTTFR